MVDEHCRIEANRVRHLLHLLQESEFWGDEKRRDFESAKLARVLDQAKRVPWYRSYPIGRVLQGIASGDFSEWRALPILGRKDLQRGREMFLTGDGEPENRPSHWLTTSGSTGEPVAVAGTLRTHTFWKAITLRDHLWHDRNFGERLGSIRSETEIDRLATGTTYPTWGIATDGIFSTAPSVSISTHATPAQQMAWLRTQRPAYLLAPPPVIKELAQAAAKEDRQFISLKGIRSFGGAVSGDLRALCLEIFGARLTDVYSTEEVGYIALQCPCSGLYHLQAESLFTEILDESGAWCRAGETGRVVVTPLQNLGMPLLRYDLGDFAEVGPPCCCGRQLPTIRRIFGRQRNMFVRPDGSRYWPALALTGIAALETRRLPIERFQVIQRSPNQILVKIKCQRPITESETLRVMQIARNSLHPECQVEVECVTAFILTASGKFEDFRCEIPSGSN